MKYCPKCQQQYPLTQRFCLEDGGLLSLQDPYHFVGRTLLDKYRIDALVGIGGMGAVYSVHHLGIDRHVALKILQPNVALGNKRTISLFEREAKMTGHLTHENIASVLDAGRTDDGIAYIVMEWLDGRTLEEVLSAEGQLDFKRTGELLRQVCAALAAAHARHIIHRDLKPANVMLIERPDGGEQVKVLDFGIAKVISETTASPVSALMGTPHYASPEQFHLGGQIDGRSDIYSLGVMLYQMLTGALPFDTPSIHELIQLQLTAPPPPIRKRRPDATAALEHLVGRLLSKDPDLRPQRAGEVTALFERALNCPDESPMEINQPAITSESAPPQVVPRAKVEEPLKKPDQESVSPGAAPTLISAPKPPVVKPSAPTAKPVAKTQIVPIRQADSQAIPRARNHKLRLAIIFALALLLPATVALYLFIGRGKVIDSVAVLPFANASADANAEYLTDGITENLISSMSRLPNLRVIARSSVFRYKGQTPEPQAVGRDLKVRAVLIGKVLVHDDGLTITAELVDTRDNSRLWGEQYNRKLADLLTVQEDISREISAKLRARLTGEEQQRVTKRHTQNVEAYQLYLKGRYHWNKRTPEMVQQGLKYFEQAVDKDPLFALAYSGVADSYFILGPLGVGALTAKEAMPKQRAAAVKALELDDTLAEAHTSIAVFRLVYDWDWTAAEREFKRALEINPSYATTHAWYAAYLMAKGQFNQAIAEVKQAQELDPFSLSISNALAGHYYHAQQYDQAIAQYQKTIAMNPKVFVPHADLAQAYEQKGMYADALAEVNQAISLSERSAELAAQLGHIYAVSGKKNEALKVLAELNEPSKQADVSPVDLALIYTGLGEKDQAFTWLQKAYDERSPSLIYLKVEQKFDPLHSEPRFADLLRRIGLAP